MPCRGKASGTPSRWTVQKEETRQEGPKEEAEAQWTTLWLSDPLHRHGDALHQLGVPVTPGQHPPQTVEGHFFQAMERTCPHTSSCQLGDMLLAAVAQTSAVSAVTQVVTLIHPKAPLRGDSARDEDGLLHQTRCCRLFR
jgi:hypothetical protein